MLRLRCNIKGDHPTSNRFIGRGNLGGDPDFKHVDVSGERRALVTFNVKIDRWVPTGENTFEDKGGFWLTIQLWGPKAEPAGHFLQKGAGVCVEGRLVLDTWQDARGIAQNRMVLIADHVDLDLGRLQSVIYKSRDSKETKATATDTDPMPPAVDENDDHDLIDRQLELSEAADLY